MPWDLPAAIADHPPEGRCNECFCSSALSTLRLGAGFALEHRGLVGETLPGKGGSSQYETTGLALLGGLGREFVVSGVQLLLTADVVMPAGFTGDFGISRPIFQLGFGLRSRWCLPFAARRCGRIDIMFVTL